MYFFRHYIAKYSPYIKCEKKCIFDGFLLLSQAHDGNSLIFFHFICLFPLHRSLHLSFSIFII